MSQVIEKKALLLLMSQVIEKSIPLADELSIDQSHSRYLS